MPYCCYTGFTSVPSLGSLCSASGSFLFGLPQHRVWLAAEHRRPCRRLATTYHGIASNGVASILRGHPIQTTCSLRKETGIKLVREHDLPASTFCRRPPIRLAFRAAATNASLLAPFTHSDPSMYPYSATVRKIDNCCFPAFL